MNNYEFWKDMDKIFDAIVAYQEKTIEFNKRFINPWVNLGNVFDKQESNDAIAAHKNAIGIDPENAQNWYELGLTFTRTGNFGKSIQAYQKAIELGFESGELYKNLGLAYSMIAKHTEAIPVFQKALELCEHDEDKVNVWNHLGNVYRKLNNYELAFRAFQNADQLERREVETPIEQPALKDSNEVAKEDAQEASITSDKDASKMDSTDTTDDIEANLKENDTDVSERMEIDEIVDHQKDDENDLQSVVRTSDERELPLDEAEEEDEYVSDMPVVFEVDYLEDSIADISGYMNTEVVEREPTEIELAEENTVTLEEDESPTSLESTSMVPEVEEVVTEVEQVETPSAEEVDDPMGAEAAMDEVEVSVSTDNVKEEVETAPALSAYEDFLMDSKDSLSKNQSNELASTDVEVTKSDEDMHTVTTDYTGEMDTKNAHVWNELGNVYFNAGSYDDAIAAYSKAIELDTQFAWPYTNLALSYVKQERLSEAILLYQRSIELFTNEKDKAITWNRLGNVYRQLDDYENAIAAYQRADELDPGNTAITRQSKLSLLGSEMVEQEAGYYL